MNSISKLPLSPTAKLILYADDILLFRPVDDNIDVLHLQSDVNLILDWIKSNGLTPNHSKTQLLPITRSKRPLPFEICVDNHVVYPSKSVKYLG